MFKKIYNKLIKINKKFRTNRILLDDHLQSKKCSILADINAKKASNNEKTVAKAV